MPYLCLCQYNTSEEVLHPSVSSHKCKFHCQELLTLRVRGVLIVAEVAFTISFNRVGLHSREDPPPLLTTRSMGQPKFRSMKSIVHSLSISSAARDTVSACDPHIWTPKRSSSSCRRSSAHSEA